MSTNERGHELTGPEMTAPEMTAEERMHALLCAVVLGEASEAERAEVEAALARSEPLRAERARIEATIGVVSSALRDGASELSGLSPEAKSALERAAAKRARPVWYRSTGLRIAASIAVLAFGALAAYRAISGAGGRSKNRLDGETTASAHDPMEKLRGLGYAGEGPVRRARGEEAKEAEEHASAAVPATAQPAPAPAEAPGVERVEEEIAALKDAAEAKGDAPADSKLGVDASAADAQVGFNVIAGSEVTGGQIEALDRLGAPVVPDVIYQGRTGATPGLSVIDLNGFGQPGAPTPAQQPPAIGSYLVAPTAPTAPEAARGALERLGYTGSGGGAPASGGPTGPSSPGPSTPPARPSAATVGKTAGRSGGGNYAGPGDTAGAPTGSDDLYLGHGEKRAGEPTADAGNPFDRDQIERLRKLGYVDDEDDARVRAQLEFEDGLRGRLTRLQELHRWCVRWPNERPREMFFRFWGDNPFEFPRLDALSTFSADVDTASYTLARRYLIDGYLPQKEQVRTEEFVNYFKGDVPAPTEGTFRIATELAPSPFSESPDAWMLRVAIRGREVAKSERQPLCLTFVVDVSGSMKEENRLELVKHALRMLLGELDGRDSIAIVAFSTEARMILPMTSAAHRALIESAIHPLHPEGSTNTEAGLRMGYEQAVAALARNATNRVVLLTDGVANVGNTDPNGLTHMVARQRQAGIYLNTVGVGMDNHNDNLLEQLADRGDGLCNYVDDAVEVRRALVDNFTGAFEPIARDLKIQVEFDPAQVERYRLLGYENRAIADADFRNARVDAAEIGAGHQVVALYEIVRRSGGDGPLATVRLLYKPPHLQGVADVESDVETEVEHRVSPRDAAGSFAAASAGYRRAVLVAQFAELLRRSIHARNDSLDRLIAEAQKLAPELKDEEFDEFARLMAKSRELVLRAYPPPGWYDRCCDEIRQRCYLEEQIRELRERLGRADELGEIERGVRNVEERLRELEMRAQSLTDADGEQLLRELQAENIALQRALLDLASKPPSRVR